MSAMNSVPVPAGPADVSKPPGPSVQGEAANRASDHPYITIIDDQVSKHVEKGAADRTSDHPYITILESDGQNLNHKQKEQLS